MADHLFITDQPGLFNLGSITFSFDLQFSAVEGNTMKLSESSYYAQISMAVVLLGVLGANSITERDSAAPADEHAVLVDNIGTYGRKISPSPLLPRSFLIKDCA